MLYKSLEGNVKVGQRYHAEMQGLIYCFEADESDENFYSLSNELDVIIKKSFAFYYGLKSVVCLGLLDASKFDEFAAQQLSQVACAQDFPRTSVRGFLKS